MISVEEGETFVREAHISEASIIVLWLSVPGFMLFVFCVTYLPGLISYAADAALKHALMEVLGVNTFGFGEIFAAVKDGIPHWLIVAFWALMTPLFIARFGWARVSTYLNTRYVLSYTDKRIGVSAHGEELTSPVSELKNVFVGQSVIGKLFKYGNVTVQTERSSVTVKNITRPDAVKEELSAVMREKEDSM